MSREQTTQHKIYEQRSSLMFLLRRTRRHQRILWGWNVSGSFHADLKLGVRMNEKKTLERHEAVLVCESWSDSLWTSVDPDCTNQISTGDVLEPAISLAYGLFYFHAWSHKSKPKCSCLWNCFFKRCGISKHLRLRVDIVTWSGTDAIELSQVQERSGKLWRLIFYFGRSRLLEI